MPGMAKNPPKSPRKPANKPGKTKPVRNKANVGKAEFTLSHKEQRFVDEYIVDCNATQAAIRAGYANSTAHKQAPLWVGKNRNTCPVSKRRIWDAVTRAQKARQERTEITADRALKEAGRLAFFDIRKLADADGNPKKLNELDDDTAAAIVGLDVVTIGNSENGFGTVLKYKIADKNSALEKLFKHLGLYEEDNRQKTNPLETLLEKIASGNNSSFKPVAVDPEHDAE